MHIADITDQKGANILPIILTPLDHKIFIMLEVSENEQNKQNEFLSTAVLGPSTLS